MNDEHVDSVIRWITERDIEMLKLLLHHPFLTVEQIEMMIFTNLKPCNWRTKANERIRRLYHAHCIDRWFPPVGEGAGSAQQHVILDRAGALVLAKHLGYDKNKMKWNKRNYIPQTYQHTLKIFDFKAMLHVLNRQLGVIGEGTVGEIIRWKVEHETRLSYRGEEGKKELVPDAMCIYKYKANGAFKIFFLEVDNATEDMDTLQSKIKRYTECYRSGEWRDQQWARILSGVFPAVVVILHEQAKAEQLSRYARSLRSNITFLFSTYNDLTTLSFKDYGNKQGKTRKILQEISVNLFEPIWFNSHDENKISL